TTTDQAETTDRLHRRHRTRQAHRSADFGIKAAAADEDAGRGVDGQVQPHYARATAGNGRAIIGARPLQRLNHAGRCIDVPDVDACCATTEAFRHDDLSALDAH